MKNKRFIWMSIGILILLLIPAIAMQFTNEVNWTPLDFIVAGILLFSAQLACEWVMSKISKKGKQVLFILLILAIFLFIWIELAVGIF